MLDNIPYNADNAQYTEPLYVYESHLGGYYTSPYELDINGLYCEECCDYDEKIGMASTRAEAFKLLSPHTDAYDVNLCENCTSSYDCDECSNIMGHGNYLPEYVQEFIITHWEE